MAKLEQGILGPFRGKVGTVVGYLWRGRHVVRGYRREINYPNTENQQAERDWFVSMVRFAATARQALTARPSRTWDILPVSRSVPRRRPSV